MPCIIQAETCETYLALMLGEMLGHRREMSNLQARLKGALKSLTLIAISRNARQPHDTSNHSGFGFHFVFHKAFHDLAFITII
jgi:hypothetical protein